MKAVSQHSLEVRKTVLIARLFPSFFPRIVTNVTGDENAMIQVCSKFFLHGDVEDCRVQLIVFDTLFELQIEARNRMGELRGHEVPHRGLNWLEQQHDVCTRDNCVQAFDFSGLLTKGIAQVRKVCKKLAQVELLETLILDIFLIETYSRALYFRVELHLLTGNFLPLDSPCSTVQIGRLIGVHLVMNFLKHILLKSSPYANGRFMHPGNLY